MTPFALFSAATKRRLAAFLADERAATAIEYAMIASGIAVAIAATVFTLGSGVKEHLYEKISNALQ